MENIAEAFKIFLATTIFAMALAVFFSMTSLAKDTSDIVFAAIDKTTLINYEADITDGANRIVTFQEILPTIYRYSQETYGVTIIDNNEIVARFDLNTESQVSSCYWTSDQYDAAGDEDQRISNKIKYEMTKYLNENIFRTVGITEITLGDENQKETIREHDELDAIIKKIYNTGNPLDPVQVAWLTENTYTDNHITQRINCDIYGGETSFSSKNPGIDEDTQDTYEAVCNGNGLFNTYKGINFTEYIVQIDSNEYITITDEAGNEENTGLLVFGTLRNNKKREIIYVRNYS